MFGAVDIGGTKTLVAVFDKHGKIKEQVKFPTPKNYEDFKIELAKIVASLSTKDFERFGVAVPGIIDRKHGIATYLGNLPWRNVPIQGDFESLWHTPVNIENDAKLAGLAEAMLLKNSYSKVLYITLSTGIGVALIVDGKIDTAIGDSGGHDLLVEHNGKHVSWESFASGKAIFERYGKLASEIDDPEIWKSIVKDLVKGILIFLAITEPDVVVVGGGVGAHFDKFGELLVEKLKQHETPMTPTPPFVQAKHPEEVVIYGCYEYAKQHHERIHAAR